MTLVNAIKIIATTPHIQEYLATNDPQAARQVAEAALLSMALEESMLKLREFTAKFPNDYAQRVGYKVLSEKVLGLLN